MSLAATAVLGGCATEDGTARFSEPAGPVFSEPTGPVASDSGPPVFSELRTLVEGAEGVVVGGARLNAGLLRRFYARRGHEPVWTDRGAEARGVVDAVLRAREHGLDPALFHAGLLRDRPGLSAVQRDVVLSAAMLTYADALARGAVPVERRRRDETLAPEPIDVADVLGGAAALADPAAAIEAFAPSTPTYRALREALRTNRPGGGPGRVAVASRTRAVEVNLERQRWLPRRLPADRVWVNVADERLVMFRGDRQAFSTRVVVGEDVERNQSPEFSTTIDASFYNPPWVIPADIAAAEILPRLDRDPEYLARNKMVLLANGEVEQLPGPEAGLGLVMFDMPNRFDVYLHDTPERSVFLRENRRISHGCIRVEHPRELAALLMEQPVEAIDRGIAAGSTTRNALPTPVPVFVVYQTAFLDPGLDGGGGLQFRKDFYVRDMAIWRRLQKAG